jgi:hypothetical protein
MYESESAVQEFQVGIGTFPNCDDLFSFTTLNGSTRSVNLEEANFNLTHGLAFYVTVLGVNVLGLEKRIISPQIVVDWVPPTPSRVQDGNGTDIDYQSDVERISATWNEFLDAESDIVEYFYCVGDRPGKASFLSVQYKLASLILRRYSFITRHAKHMLFKLLLCKTVFD